MVQDLEKAIIKHVKSFTEWQYEDSEWRRWDEHYAGVPQARWRTLNERGHMLALMQARNQLDVAIGRRLRVFDCTRGLSNRRSSCTRGPPGFTFPSV